MSPQSNWRYFHNFIVPDDRLTDLLVKELDARGLNLNNKESAVLILAEADTSYGRSLPRAFQASIRNAQQGWTRKTDSILSDHRLDFDTNIHVVRYLRGLDGKKGSSSESKENGPRKRGGSSSPEEALARIFSRSGEVSNGEYQLDYTERLVTRLIQEVSHGKIKAVGILGSDLYDKLFLLNALRPHFDDAIFFTTDLDARLSHPDFFPLTRNMVVASAYSLNANPDTDSFRMPPFRDLYQVAVYEASFAALSTSKEPDKPIKPPPEPQIYELGRATVRCN